MTVRRKTHAFWLIGALLAALFNCSARAQNPYDGYGPQPVGMPSSQPAGPMPAQAFGTVPMPGGDPAATQVSPAGPLPQFQPLPASQPVPEQPAPIPVQQAVLPPFVPPYQAMPAAQTQPVAPPAPVNAAPSGGEAWQFLGQAKALLEQNQPNRALPLIRQFIDRRPLEPEGYFWEGVALDNLQQVENALTAYAHGIQQVMKAGMDSAEMRMNVGNDLLKLKRLDLAIVQYQRAAVIDPGLAIVQLNLGRALVEKDDVEAALQCFQRCEDLHFTPYQLSYYRAKALKKVGRTQDAKAQVLMALSKLDASSDASSKLRQEFAELLNTP